MKEKLKKINMKNIKKFIIDNKKKCIIALITLIIILIGIGVFIFINRAQEELTTYKIKEESVYIYMGEIKYEFTSSITISNDDEIISLSTGEYNYELDSIPVYYQDSKKVLFPSKMSYIQTNDSFVQNYINKFSKIEEDNEYYITNNNLKYKTTDGILYDGNDLYFFLSDCTLTFGEKTYSLSSFSYVSYNYNNELYIYDYSNDKMTYLSSVTDDIVINFGDDYQLMIANDSIIYEGGTKLLMKNFNYLSKLESNI